METRFTGFGVLMLSCLLLGLAGCLETQHLRNLKDDNNPQNEKPRPEDLVYSFVSKKVLLNKCATCHRSGKENPNDDDPGEVNLETYENTLGKLRYVKSVVETGIMGFESTPKLSDYEKELILGWIAAGAPP